jgi:hypothetical protein
MDQSLITELARSGSAAVIIGVVVWWSLRDQGKILRSMDLRLAKLLEHMRRTSPTPPMGVPRSIKQERSQAIRARSHHDSDMKTGENEPTMPRTVTDEDLDQ